VTARDGRLWIVRTGATLPEIAARRGDFEDWIRTGMDWPRERTRVVDVVAGEPLPAPPTPSGVVVTGSSAFVSEREEWSERSAEWLGRAVAAGTAVLGICYGHQLLAHALGGRVGPNPRGREIGTVELRFAAGGDPLLGPLPERAPLQVTHVESVLELPAGLDSLAASALDPHHAFRAGERAWGVQFHPEFDADVMRGYIDGRRDVLREEGLDPDALRAAVVAAPAGRAVLRGFADRVREVPARAQ